jgi:hypothetical protein
MTVDEGCHSVCRRCTAPVTSGNLCDWKNWGTASCSANALTEWARLCPADAFPFANPSREATVEDFCDECKPNTCLTEKAINASKVVSSNYCQSHLQWRTVIGGEHNQADCARLGGRWDQANFDADGNGCKFDDPATCTAAGFTLQVVTCGMEMYWQRATIESVQTGGANCDTATLGGQPIRGYIDWHAGLCCSDGNSICHKDYQQRYQLSTPISKEGGSGSGCVPFLMKVNHTQEGCLQCTSRPCKWTACSREHLEVCSSLDKV